MRLASVAVYRFAASPLTWGDGSPRRASAYTSSICRAERDHEKSSSRRLPRSTSSSAPIRIPHHAHDAGGDRIRILRVHQLRRISRRLEHPGPVGRHHRGAAGERLQDGKAKTLRKARIHQRGRLAIERTQRRVAGLADEANARAVRPTRCRQTPARTASLRVPRAPPATPAPVAARSARRRGPAPQDSCVDESCPRSAGIPRAAAAVVAPRPTPPRRPARGTLSSPRSARPGFGAGARRSASSGPGAWSRRPRPPIARGRSTTAPRTPETAAAPGARPRAGWQTPGRAR